VSFYVRYEFHAIDRLLTGEEQQAVARLSSRVGPHPRQAVFLYHWSDFPGNPREVLAKYYDAMFYTASWGSRQIVFRFPRSALDLHGASVYCQPLIVEDYISFRTVGEYMVLDIGFDEEGGRWFEFEGELATMLGLRDDILRGDYRALYLAWLKVLEVDDLLESVPEPPVPPSLRTLSPALRALVEFLEIDETLIEVATEASADRESQPEGWLGSALSRLSAEERDAFLLRLARGEPQLSAALNRRLREISPLPEAAFPPRRTVGWLLREAEARRERERQRQAAEAEARRIRDLEALAERKAEAWAEVEGLIERMQARPYDEAVAQMVRLRELAEYQGEEDAFQRRIDRICERYSRRPSLLGRMRDAGLSPTAEKQDV
jgi:regulator of protease activity HflC (stomatin/prohibitin superfamily)